MTTNNNQIPADLTAKLARLTGEIEAAIRADERARVREQIVAAWNNQCESLRDGLAKATGNQTGMHGEPLAAEQEPAKVNNWAKMTPSHYRLVAALERGFHAVPTIAGNFGFTKQTVYCMLNVLRKNGYELDIRNVSGTAAGYRKIYRIAKAG